MASLRASKVKVNFGQSYGPDKISSIKVTLSEDGQGSSCQVTLRDVEMRGVSLKKSGDTAARSVGSLIALQSQPLVQFSSGQEITITIDNKTWNFIHIGTQYSFGPPGTVTIQGAAAKWVLSRDNLNGSYKWIRYQDLARRLCNQFGVEFSLRDGDDPLYAAIDITGLSAFGLISREAKELGLFTRDEGATVYAYSPDFSEGTYAVKSEYFSGNFQMSFSARAQNDDKIGQEKSLPGNAPEENRSQVDRVTGRHITSAYTGVQAQSEELQFGAQRKPATAVVGGANSEKELGRTDSTPGSSAAGALAKKLEKQKKEDIQATYSFSPLDDQEAYSILPSYKVLFQGSIPLAVPREWRVAQVTISWAGIATVDLSLTRAVDG